MSEEAIPILGMAAIADSVSRDEVPIAKDHIETGEPKIGDW
jgi:hypothetical protein